MWFPSSSSSQPSWLLYLHSGALVQPWPIRNPDWCSLVVSGSFKFPSCIDFLVFSCPRQSVRSIQVPCPSLPSVGSWNGWHPLSLWWWPAAGLFHTYPVPYPLAANYSRYSKRWPFLSIPRNLCCVLSTSYRVRSPWSLHALLPFNFICWRWPSYWFNFAFLCWPLPPWSTYLATHMFIRLGGGVAYRGRLFRILLCWFWPWGHWDCTPFGLFTCCISLIPSLRLHSPLGCELFLRFPGLECSEARPFLHRWSWLLDPSSPANFESADTPQTAYRIISLQLSCYRSLAALAIVDLWPFRAVRSFAVRVSSIGPPSVCCLRRLIGSFPNFGWGGFEGERFSFIVERWLTASHGWLLWVLTAGPRTTGFFPSGGKANFWLRSQMKQFVAFLTSTPCFPSSAPLSGTAQPANFYCLQR